MNIQLLNDAVSNLSNTINNLNMSNNQDKKNDGGGSRLSIVQSNGNYLMVLKITNL